MVRKWNALYNFNRPLAMSTSAKAPFKYYYNNKNREEEFPEKPDNNITQCKTGLFSFKFDGVIGSSTKLIAAFPPQ